MSRNEIQILDALVLLRRHLTQHEQIGDIDQNQPCRVPNAQRAVEVHVSHVQKRSEQANHFDAMFAFEEDTSHRPAVLPSIKESGRGVDHRPAKAR